MFDERDVRGICDVLAGTKEKDVTQIGKFGIGFKSVYAFTASPQIHSGQENFVIENYIHPRQIDALPLLPDETLFVFPFNHPEKPAPDIFKKIKNRLNDLGIRTLLFLDEIDQIVWNLEGKRAGAYIRYKEKVEEYVWWITLLGEEGKETREERWLVFQQPVEIPNTNIFTKVEIGFKLGLDEKGNKQFIQPINRSTLFAYFETALETQLKFIIQGQYHTTPAHDNVLSDDDYNKLLIKETSKLLVSSLESLKKMDMLNAQTLESMPLKVEDFQPGTFFRPIYEEFRRALSTQPLLPATEGEYTSAEGSKLGRGTELIQLLTKEKLRALFGFSKDFRWLSDEITRDKTPELRNFLMGSLNVEEIDPEKFALKISPQFLKIQSDEWMIQFYEFLDGQKALWRPKTKSSYDGGGILRSKPFIRLENEKLMQPFDQYGNPQVFLPGSEATEYPTVKHVIAENLEALKFLRSSGLGEPDIADEVIKFILQNM